MERCPPPPPPTPPPPHFRPFYPLSLSCFCLLSFLLLAVWRVRLNSTLAGGCARSVAFGGTLDHEEWCPRVDPLDRSVRLSSTLPGPAQVRVALSLAELYTAYWPGRSLEASTHRARCLNRYQPRAFQVCPASRPFSDTLAIIFNRFATLTLRCTQR